MKTRIEGATFPCKGKTQSSPSDSDVHLVVVMIGSIKLLAGESESAISSLSSSHTGPWVPHGSKTQTFPGDLDLFVSCQWSKSVGVGHGDRLGDFKLSPPLPSPPRRPITHDDRVKNDRWRLEKEGASTVTATTFDHDQPRCEDDCDNAGGGPGPSGRPRAHWVRTRKVH